MREGMDTPSTFHQYRQNLHHIAESPQLVQNVDNSRRYQLYVRSADVLLQQIRTYRQQKDYESLYTFLHRLVTFYLRVLSKHNAAEQPQNRVDFRRLKREATSAMTELENLKDSEQLTSCFNRKFSPSATISSMTKEHGTAVLSITAPEMQNPHVVQLRQVVINRRLVDEFLTVAFQHLQRNVEFCGILAGKLTVDNVLQVTHLLIPKQEGTSDTCHALNEDDLFKYQHSADLLTIGWIHTHPSQSAFLSSVDLKTHYSYQLMLDESIAIVCAPTADPNLGIFRITDRGMHELRDILQKDPRWSEEHHEKVEQVLFGDCKHAICSYDVDVLFEVVDLR